MLCGTARSHDRLHRTRWFLRVCSIHSFAEIIRGIEQVAHRHHYAVLLGDTQYSRVREQVYADFLSTRQADGLITLMPHVPKVSFGVDRRS